MSNTRYRTNEGELIPIIAIIILNVLIYLGVNIAAYMGTNIVPYLGLYGSWGGLIERPWTIITYMFTQANFFHLLANMLTFYFFGSFLNRVAGERNFLLIYFAGGIIGGLFVLWLSSPYIPTIGASGAVLALGGALIVVAPKVSVYIFPIPVPMPLWVGVLIGFLILLPIGSISWQAHLGGLLSGLLIGLYLRHRLRIAV